MAWKRPCVHLPHGPPRRSRTTWSTINFCWRKNLSSEYLVFSIEGLKITFCQQKFIPTLKLLTPITNISKYMAENPEQSPNPDEELRNIDKEKILDAKIDIEAEIAALSLELHQAEYPDRGETVDQKRVDQLRRQINELKSRSDKFN